MPEAFIAMLDYKISPGIALGGCRALARGWNEAAPHVCCGSCVTTAVCTTVPNCARDEGGPFEVGNQALISSHRKLLSSKAMVVNVAESREMIPIGKVDRGERKRTAVEVSKAD